MAFQWSSPRTWVAGEKPSAATLNTHIRNNLEALNGFVRKTANEDVTSSTAMQNDNELLFTIPQAGTYAVDLVLIGSSAANSAGDIKFGFTFPTGSLTMRWIGPDPATTGGAVAQAKFHGATDASSPSTAIDFGLTTTSQTIIGRGLLVATAAGTLTLQWAQFASNANASSLATNSYMTVKQVA